eukprot:NODE_2747_length_884_cov_3.296743.p3 GENE.NODE_2747_length_884_cov_3.296743~~NODE_2747_length_884_cov_3.296743.p3  ORF type:complete len:169 (+),score=16.76 NODE_2747_length_884_cov_3.296743:183-689(+)
MRSVGVVTVMMWPGTDTIEWMRTIMSLERICGQPLVERLRVQWLVYARRTHTRPQVVMVLASHRTMRCTPEAEEVNLVGHLHNGEVLPQGRHLADLEDPPGQWGCGPTALLSDGTEVGGEAERRHVREPPAATGWRRRPVGNGPLVEGLRVQWLRKCIAKCVAMLSCE